MTQPLRHLLALFAATLFVAPAVSRAGSDLPVSGLVAGPQGTFWYLTDHSIARIAPNGDVTQFLIDGSPAGISSGPDGNVWFATQGPPDSIQAIDATGSSVHDFTLTDPARPSAMTSTPNGKLWVFYLGSFSGLPMLGTIDSNGTMANVAVNSSVFSLAPRAGGGVWFIGASEVGHVDDSLTVAKFALPTFIGSFVTFGFDVASGADGNAWIIVSLSSCAFSPCIPEGLALLEVTADGTMTQLEPPVGVSLGGGLTFAADGNLWLLGALPASGANPQSALLRLSHGAISYYPLAAAATGFNLSSPDGNLWFPGSGGQFHKIHVDADSIFWAGFDEL